MKDGTPGDELNILLRGAELQGDGLGRECARDIQQQSAGQHHLSGAGNVCLQLDAQADLHIGCQELRAGIGR